MTKVSKYSSGLEMAQVELPEEIILQNILPRLPVKSLLRFTCVSKRWRLVIKTDLEFAKLQYRLACQHNTLSHKLLLSKCAFTRSLESVDLDMPAWTFGERCSIRKVRFKFLRKLDKEVALLGSCNGLVFVMRLISHFETFYICNPSTGFYKELAYPCISAKNSSFDQDNLVYYGVGYLSATDDYKVLAAYLEEDVYVVELFSLRAREWKRIEGPPEENSDIVYHGTVCNEVLHWLNTEEDDRLTAFDLVKEEFRTMQMPDFSGDGKAISYLGVSVGGCLCLSRYPEGTCETIDFWVMGKYGVWDSWTKLHSVKLFEPEDLMHNTGFLVMESCTIVWASDGIGLTRIDHQAEAMHEQVGFYGLNPQVCITDYVETLLRINY